MVQVNLICNTLYFSSTNILLILFLKYNVKSLQYVNVNIPYLCRKPKQGIHPDL
jgi:hypothetical protein